MQLVMPLPCMAVAVLEHDAAAGHQTCCMAAVLPDYVASVKAVSHWHPLYGIYATANQRQMLHEPLVTSTAPIKGPRVPRLRLPACTLPTAAQGRVIFDQLLSALYKYTLYMLLAAQISSSGCYPALAPAPGQVDLSTCYARCSTGHSHACCHDKLIDTCTLGCALYSISSTSSQAT